MNFSICKEWDLKNSGRYFFPIKPPVVITHLFFLKKDYKANHSFYLVKINKKLFLKKIKSFVHLLCKQALLLTGAKGT